MTEFSHLLDARAGAVKVAERYGLSLKIYRLEPSGRFIVTNSRQVPVNAAFVEEHVGSKEPGPNHGAVTVLTTEKAV